MYNWMYKAACPQSSKLWILIWENSTEEVVNYTLLSLSPCLEDISLPSQSLTSVWFPCFLTSSPGAMCPGGHALLVRVSSLRAYSVSSASSISSSGSNPHPLHCNLPSVLCPYFKILFHSSTHEEPVLEGNHRDWAQSRAPQTCPRRKSKPPLLITTDAQTPEQNESPLNESVGKVPEIFSLIKALGDFFFFSFLITRIVWEGLPWWLSG